MFFAERAIAGTPVGRQILSRYPELQWIGDYQEFRAPTVHREKQAVIFALKRGAWLREFRCYANSEYEYFTLNVGEGCPFNCVYCYLQTYSNHAGLVLFVNVDGIADELRSLPAAKPVWISSGLLTDSLVAERYWPSAAGIAGLLPANCVLELRTKSSDVDVLLRSAVDRSKAVVSWSLNPEPVALKYEYGASSLNDRLEGAVKAVKNGYRVGFHFDPVFCYEGYRADYRSLIEHLFELFEPGSVAFVSVGLFRYTPELGALIRRRFPYHDIMTGEFFRDADGKYHYLRILRKEMYAWFSDVLQPWKGRVPVLAAMEPDRQLAGSL